MQWKFTKSEQFDEVKDVFKQLSERFNRQGKKTQWHLYGQLLQVGVEIKQYFPGSTG